MSADFDPADTTCQRVARETADRIAAIEALLREEPAIIPIAPTWALRAIHFTPSGAALYRMLAAEWLGPAWEDEIHVSKESYREEHRYCETEEGLRADLQKYQCSQEKVLASKVVPIGPWCVHWWKRFPRGYRLELQLGDPGAIGQTDSKPVRTRGHDPRRHGSKPGNTRLGRLLPQPVGHQRVTAQVGRAECYPAARPVEPCLLDVGRNDTTPVQPRRRAFVAAPPPSGFRPLPFLHTPVIMN